MQITHLFAGKPQPFGPKRTPSSIVKQAFKALTITHQGAEEDEQGNKKLHGGPEMALHQYAQCGYTLLQQQFSAIAEILLPGTIGENISAPLMNEDNVFIGDIYQINDVQIQVASPRAPCARINQRYATAKIDQSILLHGNTGWYYRVLAPGTIRIGDSITLVHRNDAPVSVRTLMHMCKPPLGYAPDVSQLRIALATPGLAGEWQNKIKRKINQQHR